MAEGFARRLAPEGTAVFSAGTAPVGIHPLALRVMAESGIDLSGQRSKRVDELPSSEFDLVVTLCGSARETCPVLPGAPRRVHWPLPDPASAKGGPEEVLGAFRSVRDEIRSRVAELMRDPEHPEGVADA